MTGRLSCNVSLTQELKAFIAGRLDSGDYGNVSEVVRAGLRALRDGGAATPSVRAGIWPAAGGACGGLIRTRDWSRTTIGAVEAWPEALRAAIMIVLDAPMATLLTWGRDDVLFYNDRCAALLGHRHPAALGASAAEVLPELQRIAVPLGEAENAGTPTLTISRAGRQDAIVVDLFRSPVVDTAGEPVGMLMTLIDNSARAADVARLSASEAEMRLLTDAVPMLVAYIGHDHAYRFANAAYETWFGIPSTEIVGRSVRDVLGEAAYAHRRIDLDKALAGEASIAEMLVSTRDGVPRRCEFRYTPRVEPDGSISGVHVVGIDVGQRALRESALAASDRRFRTAMDAVHGVLWTNSADGRMVGDQPGWSALTGQQPHEYRDFGWADAVHPDDVQASIESWNAAVAAKSMYVNEHRVRRHDGQWRNFAIRALPILCEDGNIVEWVGVHTDITHQRAAEAALRAQADDLVRQIRHRERAEAQLRQLNETLETRVIEEIAERRQAEARLAQAQKMETVGKLTGGVAHDFNNLLQVVGGNLQLLAKDVAGNDRAERRVANAMAGVSRGAKLAAQLLAFGRRQALEPKVVNVTRLVQGMDDMLRRAIGEAIDVEAIYCGGLWNTFIDPAQIENAVLNLAINARDAMDGRGKLTIELSNVHLDDAYARSHEEVTAGQYVMLAVSDTGSGMSPEIMDRVFEPFFSTKGEGKGSGLGLSMVYGFVKQSGGHVKIYSEVGEGTTIRLYLPRATAAEDIEVAVDTGPVCGGSETVLVVEDDEGVRATVVEMLGDLGYRVLKAVDASSALSVIESGVPIDMLFTDVVMPGKLKSPELARQARERLPDISVLFTSGYTENSIVHGGRLDAGVELLSKPYTREALARKFRHVLANQRQRRMVAAEPARGPAPSTVTPAGASVLLVEDDAMIRSGTAEVLQDAGYVVVEAASAEEAVTALQTTPVDILVTDVNLPGASGPELASIARTLRPSIIIVYATGDPIAVRGETDTRLLGKPYGTDALLAAVKG